MHGAWTGFGAHGDPSPTGLTWEPYDTGRRLTMRFDLDTEVVADPRADERELWDAILP
ncbi:MAG: hypothetical protein U5R31_06300 [Acidimicrobiia bacterium]|nr:hypothetical protein [Acidimicrobiia bacterium]